MKFVQYNLKKKSMWVIFIIIRYHAALFVSLTYYSHLLFYFFYFSFSSVSFLFSSISLSPSLFRVFSLSLSLSKFSFQFLKSLSPSFSPHYSSTTFYVFPFFSYSAFRIFLVPCRHFRRGSNDLEGFRQLFLDILLVRGHVDVAVTQHLQANSNIDYIWCILLAEDISLSI